MSAPASMKPIAGTNRWLRRSIWLVACAVMATYLAICAYMYAIQRSMLFIPDIRDVSAEVERFPGAEAVILTPSDGERLNAWWKPPRSGQDVVYLYLHGNGANLSRRAGRFQRLTEDGSGLLAVSWRGYGGSSGSPSEAGLRLDGLAGHDWVSARIDPARIVLFGESLGTGVAIGLAAERKAALLVLDSPYASIVDLGALRFPFLPVALLSRDPFRSIDLAPRVAIPVIAQHCTRDWVIPLSESQRLMRAFPNEPDFSIIDGRCHVPDVARALLPKTRSWIAAR
ncbi:MAG: alpha/beta hydrolase [Hyphomicrobiales bacterium]|nr:alpha/beta hydrolase [Hyphomicrobiales bacterium]